MHSLETISRVRHSSEISQELTQGPVIECNVQHGGCFPHRCTSSLGEVLEPRHPADDEGSDARPILTVTRTLGMRRGPSKARGQPWYFLNR